MRDDELIKRLEAEAADLRAMAGKQATYQFRLSLSSDREGAKPRVVDFDAQSMLQVAWIAGVTCVVVGLFWLAGAIWMTISHIFWWRPRRWLIRTGWADRLGWPKRPSAATGGGGLP